MTCPTKSRDHELFTCGPRFRMSAEIAGVRTQHEPAINQIIRTSEMNGHGATQNANVLSRGTVIIHGTRLDTGRCRAAPCWTAVRAMTTTWLLLISLSFPRNCRETLNPIVPLAQQTALSNSNMSPPDTKRHGKRYVERG